MVDPEEGISKEWVINEPEELPSKPIPCPLRPVIPFQPVLVELQDEGNPLLKVKDLFSG